MTQAASDPAANYTARDRTSSLPRWLTDEEARHFETAFATITEANHLTVIVEGVPLIQSLNDDQLANLKRALSGVKRLSTAEIVARIADAYDYDSEESGMRTYLLRKRYSDPNDLPFVTYGEVTKDVESVLEFLDPESTGRVVFGKNSIHWTLYDSLTPEQIRRGRQGIPMSDFSAAQRSLALASGREALLHGPTFMLRWVYNELQKLSDKRVVFKWLRLREGEAFGFEAPFGLADTIGPFPLNNGFMTSASGSYMHASIRRAVATGPSTVQSPLLPEEPFAGVINGESLSSDPFNPTDLDKFLAPGMFSGRLPSTFSLGDVVQRFTSTERGGPQISVDERIGNKPICLYGAAFSDVDHIIRGAGAVYGLPVFEGEVGKYSIGLPRPRPVDRPQDTSAEITRLIPAPIMRYYARQRDRIGKIVQSDGSDDVGSAGLQAIASKKSVLDRQKVSDLAQREWYLPAVRRLLVLAQPSVPTRNSPPVRADSLGPEALRLMTLVLLAGDPMREVDKLRTFSLPRCLSDPNALVLKVQKNYQSGLGQDVVSVTFGYTDSSGKFANEGGAGGARVPTEPVDPAIANAPPKPLDPLGGLPRPR